MEKVENLNKGIEAYYEGNYKVAIDYLDRVEFQEDYPENHLESIVRLYKALCHCRFAIQEQNPRMSGHYVAEAFGDLEKIPELLSDITNRLGIFGKPYQTQERRT